MLEITKKEQAVTSLRGEPSAKKHKHKSISQPDM
jgi:hypothetical protein